MESVNPFNGEIVARYEEMARETVNAVIEAAHQASDHAMVIATPHGEARILGTTFRLAVEPASTRLDVVEGKVRLTRTGGGEVDVPGGHSATAAPGLELAARPQPRRVAETVLKFGFEDGFLPKAFDTGFLERGPERAGNRFCVAGAVVKISDDGKGLFPYAEDRPDRMQLRITNITPLAFVANFPQIWRGEYEDLSSTFDYLVDDVTISYRCCRNIAAPRCLANFSSGMATVMLLLTSAEKSCFMCTVIKRP